MLTEITGALTAITHATKLAHGLFEAAQDAKVKGLVNDFQGELFVLHGKLLEIQAQYEEVSQAKRELERQLLQRADWAQQAARYRLHELAPGMLVYAPKPGEEGDEPPHYLCPHCWEQRERALLMTPKAGYTNYVCHKCKLELCPTPPASPTVVPRAGPYQRRIC